MISDHEYQQYDGVGLAELVRRGEVKASELLEAAIRRADSVNPRLNAIVIPMYEIGRERAASAPEGPFGGVPFLIKDLKQEYAGVLASWGSLALRNKSYRPSEHSDRDLEIWWRARQTVLVRRSDPRPMHVLQHSVAPCPTGTGPAAARAPEGENDEDERIP